MSTARSGQRTFVARIAGGASLLEALEERVREEGLAAGSVSGFGVLRTATVDLPVAGGGRSEPYELEGPFELLALSGRVGAEGPLEVSVQLARATDSGLSCVGGRVVAAIAEEVELWISALDVPAAERSAPERDEPPREPSRSRGWAAVAAASEVAAAPPAARGRSSGEGGFVPSRGEFIDHKVFGLCRVEAVKPDGTMVIRLETGRRKQLKLDALEVHAPKEGTSRVIYPVKVRR